MAELALVFWHWWVFAVVMLGIEVMVSGFFFLWFSLAGLVVGLVLFIFPSTPIATQLLLISTLSIIFIYSWRCFAPKHKSESDQPLLNKRGHQYIGCIFPLSSAIENGRGKVKIGDSIWTVRGDDYPLGIKVKVVDIKGTVFSVKPAITDEDGVTSQKHRPPIN